MSKKKRSQKANANRLVRPTPSHSQYVNPEISPGLAEEMPRPRKNALTGRIVPDAVKQGLINDVVVGDLLDIAVKSNLVPVLPENVETFPVFPVEAAHAFVLRGGVRTLRALGAHYPFRVGHIYQLLSTHLQAKALWDYQGAFALWIHEKPTQEKTTR